MSTRLSADLDRSQDADRPAMGADAPTIRRLSRGIDRARLTVRVECEPSAAGAASRATTRSSIARVRIAREAREPVGDAGRGARMSARRRRRRRPAPPAAPRGGRRRGRRTGRACSGSSVPRTGGCRRRGRRGCARARRAASAGRCSSRVDQPDPRRQPSQQDHRRQEEREPAGGSPPARSGAPARGRAGRSAPALPRVAVASRIESVALRGASRSALASCCRRAARRRPRRRRSPNAPSMPPAVSRAVADDRAPESWISRPTERQLEDPVVDLHADPANRISSEDDERGRRERSGSARSATRDRGAWRDASYPKGKGGPVGPPCH